MYKTYFLIIFCNLLCKITMVLLLITKLQPVLETLEFGPPSLNERGHTIAGNKRRGLCINGDNGD